LWNPEKELKVRTDPFSPHSENRVESGEGIES